MDTEMVTETGASIQTSVEATKGARAAAQKTNNSYESVFLCATAPAMEQSKQTMFSSSFLRGQCEDDKEAFIS